jgi:hypothetical protein
LRRTTSVTEDIESTTMWQVFPARHGIVLRPNARSDGREAEAAAIDAGAASKDVFLQHGDASVENELEPPLSLLLSDEELAELGDQRLAAATHYGTANQDKASNEDFALSAVLRSPDRSEFSFAVVADGVSTRTFWSARAARLACIGTFKAVRACLAEGIDPGQEDRHAEIAERVANFIRQALAIDADKITASDVVPSGWDRSIYEKHRGDAAAWYRSTLLFGVMGANGGVGGLTGDGGVRGLLLQDKQASEPLEMRVMSAETGRELTSYVSRTFSRADITLLPLRSAERLATHVILTSDGLDLSLQGYSPNEVLEDGRRCHSRYRDLPLDTATTAFDFLERLAATSTVVADNLSMARLSWPIPRHGCEWASWKREPFASWQNGSESPAGDQPAGETKPLPTLTIPAWIAPAAAGFVIGSATLMAGLTAFGAVHMQQAKIACPQPNATAAVNGGPAKDAKGEISAPTEAPGESTETPPAPP